MDIQRQHPLHDLTTFSIGGPADYFVEITNEKELLEAFDFAQNKQVPIFLLGGGSNIVVHDKGFPGLVIANHIKGISALRDHDQVELDVGAGETWDEIVTYAARNNWAGIECLAGIPGKVGAAPIQNIGAYGQEVSSVIKNVRAFDTHTQKMVDLDNPACRFEYRKSIFNGSLRDRYLITHVTLELKAGGIPTITYQDLKDQFPDPEKAALSEVRKAVIETRAKKGMVILPGYENYRSAGSFFKHPIVSKKDFAPIHKAWRQTNHTDHIHWFWPLASGDIKLVAARLIQEAGFEPGYRKGNVGISPKHALALINHEGGTAEELTHLAREIQERVEERFGVRLVPEPEFVGFAEHPLS